MNRQSGMTMAELLATLAIGAILISAGIPSYQSLVLSNAQTASVNEFIAGLSLARSEAITKNVRVTACTSKNGIACDATANWSDGWLVFADMDNDGTLDAAEPVLKTSGETSRLSTKSSEFTSFITFRPNGRAMVNTPRENTGQFTFCDKRGASYAKTVIIETSGRPRASKYDIDGGTPSC